MLPRDVQGICVQGDPDPSLFFSKTFGTFSVSTEMVLGLTGGMGCGKSEAAGLFAECGWHRIDTDAIVRELLESDAATRRAVKKAFGPVVIKGSGAVDRAAVAKIVFADRAELSRLEAILHPLVRSRWLAEVETDEGELWVVEIPLLFEKGLEKEVDFTLCIASHPKVQAERLASRGLSPKEAAQRMARQLPLAQKIERADFVITNNGSLAFLKDQVTWLASILAQSTV